jgi:hypothetical protein
LRQRRTFGAERQTVHLGAPPLCLVRSGHKSGTPFAANATVVKTWADGPLDLSSRLGSGAFSPQRVTVARLVGGLRLAVDKSTEMHQMRGRIPGNAGDAPAHLRKFLR